MLKQRILAAAVLIPAFLAAMFLLDGPAFAAVMGAVVLLASWEWTRLAAIPIPVSQAVYIATMALAMWLLWVSPARIDLWHWLLIAALLWWSLVLLWIVRHRSDGGPGLPSLLKLNAGYLVLLPAWVALVSLHTERGPYWLLFLLVVVWVADSGAYFVGKAWGRRKLAPGISPGKSIEGVYGGMLASVIPALGFGWALGFRASELLALVLLTVLCAAFSVVGDLFESLLKRQANMKDSSHLIPGHGGVLDRIDSVTAAAPWFVMGLSWIAGGGYMIGVTVLGATGSIGVSTLDVLARHSDQFHVVALTAHRDVDKLTRLCLRHGPRYAVMVDEQAARELSRRLKDQGSTTEVLAGAVALAQVAALTECDYVMAAIVGAAGLAPTLAAARAGKRILLANKEALVMSGRLFMEEVQRHGAELLPIDSEHNAVFQCMPAGFANGLGTVGVEQILLTASGGPFRERDPASLRDVTPEQAIAHPNWEMGRKISVDSATMMNKGLEVIEACWLFHTDADHVQVVVHPQSVIHSLVRYVDGSVLAQLGNPDMRTPIAHALAWPRRLAAGVAPLDLFSVARLDFEEPDLRRFPCLALSYQAARAGGTSPTVLNAANEVAVQAFLERRLAFTGIARVIAAVLDASDTQAAESLEHVLDEDARARGLASQLIESGVVGS